MSTDSAAVPAVDPAPTRPCHCDRKECGLCHLWHTSPLHRRLWTTGEWDGPAPLPATLVPPNARSLSEALVQPDGGPGTELSELVKGYGIGIDATCGCYAYARQMDRWGVAGCRGRRAEIVRYFGAKVKGASWREKLRAVVRAAGDALAGGFVPDPADVPGSLVDEAVRRAEVKAGQRLTESG